VLLISNQGVIDYTKLKLQEGSIKKVLGKSIKYYHANLQAIIIGFHKAICIDTGFDTAKFRFEKKIQMQMQIQHQQCYLLHFGYLHTHVQKIEIALLFLI
tara:strand:- start:3863 stop:4162 length:300 start_codon:yes stop_codon:yes gene_type:complete